MNFAGLPVSQKTPPFISQKLRRFARGQDCAMRLPGICNRDPDTTVLCHIRRFSGAGIAQKPHDFIAYHGCSACHSAEAEAGDDDLLHALIETQRRVYAHFGGLTP